MMLFLSNVDSMYLAARPCWHFHHLSWAVSWACQGCRIQHVETNKASCLHQHGFLSPSHNFSLTEYRQGRRPLSQTPERDNLPLPSGGFAQHIAIEEDNVLEFTSLVGPYNVERAAMHRCLGCAPCPSRRLHAESLQSRSYVENPYEMITLWRNLPHNVSRA